MQPRHSKDLWIRFSKTLIVLSSTWMISPLPALRKKKHLEDLRIVFRRLTEQGLVIRLEKCLFGVPSLEFLGHQVSKNGSGPRQAKVEVIQNFPQPSTIKGVQEFLGMINFYHRFLPNIASILSPLYAALKSSKPQQEISWLHQMKQAFVAAKCALVNATMLAHPCSDCPFALTSDASDRAVGAVLEQFKQGQWQHLAFFTDHKPFVHAMAKTAELWSSRQQRHLSAISEFTTDIRHVSGKNNTVADCLSRATTANTVSLGIDYTDMARGQPASLDVQAYKTAVISLEIINTKVSDQGPELLCDISTGSPRRIVPPIFRRSVFNTVHSLAHSGVKATVKLTSEKFVWHGMRKQVSSWVKQCHHCQSSKVHKHTKSPLEEFSVPAKRFSHINVDIVGPLPFSSGFTHLLTIIDRNTRWPEEIPLRGFTSSECVQALISGWIARFGVPGDISSDRGSQFTSSLWNDLAHRLGVKLHHTSAYHPQANGMIERFHRSLKTALKARLTGLNWVEELPWVLLGLRYAPKQEFGYSSAELVYGESLTVPGEFIPPGFTNDPAQESPLKFRGNIPTNFPRPASSHSSTATFVPPSLMTAKYVYVRRDGTKGTLQRPYTGPYAVLTPGDKTFLLDIGGRTERISVDRLKPAFYDPALSVQVAKPPPRGRPTAKQRPSAGSSLQGPSASPSSGASSGSCRDEGGPTVQTSRAGRTTRSPLRYQ